jgi:hypothetical protein
MASIIANITASVELHVPEHLIEKVKQMIADGDDITEICFYIGQQEGEQKSLNLLEDTVTQQMPSDNNPTLTLYDDKDKIICYNEVV